MAALSRLGQRARARAALAGHHGRRRVSARSRLKDARTERKSLLRQLADGDHDDRDGGDPRAAARSSRARSRPARAGRAPREQPRRVLDRRGHAGRRPRRGARRRPRTTGWTPGDAARDALRVLEVAAGVALIVARRRARRSRCSPAVARRSPARWTRRAPARARARRRLTRTPRGACARSCGIPAAMPARAEDTAALLARVPAFEELGPAELAAVAAVAVPRSFDGGRGGLPRGRRVEHVLRRPRRPRARDPRARRRAPDHARDVRPRRHLRRAGDVRRRACAPPPSRPSTSSRCSRSSAPTCAG